jgi:hypothetical protein
LETFAHYVSPGVVSNLKLVRLAQGATLFGKNVPPNIRKRSDVTDPQRLHDIEQKLRCWGYLSHYPDAEHDVAPLLDQLAERDARIAELEALLARNEWVLSQDQA